jgi:hypothetical protein
LPNAPARTGWEVELELPNGVHVWVREGKAVWDGPGVRRILAYSETVDMRKAFGAPGKLGVFSGCHSRPGKRGSHLTGNRILG